MALVDAFDRTIDYLRISVTDRCNLRCSYCMPKRGVTPKPHHEILTYEEIRRFTEAAVAAGISKVRVTGGEPLVRKDAVSLIEMLAAIAGLDDLSLTTNGLLLPTYGAALKRAGLRRVNISLDCFDARTYREVTRTGDVERARAGLEAALELGLEPVKVNTVLMRGVNDDPRDFIELIHEYPVHVRFIELMPIGAWDPALYVTIDELKGTIERYGVLEPVGGPVGAGPARYYRFEGARGTFGFISPVSSHFCGTCNRLRVTPDGKLRTCLFSDAEFDIRALLRDNVSNDELVCAIEHVIQTKPERHDIGQAAQLKRRMSQIGG